MKNSLIYSVCAATLLVCGCALKVEPISFEAPQVEYTVQQETVSVSVGEPQTFGAKVLKGEGLSLSWYVGDVLEASTSEFTYTWDKPGDYVVRFEASNGAGSQSKTYNVNVTDVLEIFLSSEAEYEIKTSTDCLEQDFIRVCAVVVKGSNVKHEWSVDGVKQECSDALFNTYKTPTGKGTHTVSYKGSNSVGTVTKQFTVNVVERPLTVSYSEEASTIVMSKGGSQTLSAEVLFGGTGAAFVWTLNGEQVGTESSYTFNAVEPGQFVVKFSCKNAKGETAERTWTIVVPAREEILMEDFENNASFNGGKSYKMFSYSSGATLSIVDNPKPDAVNGSATCLKASGSSGSGYFMINKSGLSAIGINWSDYAGLKVDMYIENSKKGNFCPALDHKTTALGGFIWAPQSAYEYEKWITIEYDLNFAAVTSANVQPRAFLVYGSTAGKGNGDSVYYDNFYLYKK